MIDFESAAIEGSEPESQKAEGKADQRVAVYVKISQAAREILDEAAVAPRTRATVIENLLESFARESGPIRERILSGKSPNTLREHGELLELRSWAEHAFQNQRYVWAAGMYRLLADHPSGSEGLRNICNYRLSLCLIRLSYDVRQEALESGMDEVSYDLALKTLAEAISYTHKVRRRLASQLLFPELVLYYNLASCHSLRAQYLVESKLDPKSELVERLCHAAKDVPAKEKVWKIVGETWRANQNAEAVDAEGNKVLHYLDQVLPMLTSDSHDRDWDEMDLPFERIWLVDSTKSDEDFIFLRSDKQKWQGEYEKWSKDVLQGRKPISDAVLSLIKPS